MSTNLKEKTYRAAFWSAVDTFGTRLIQFVIGVVLARMLEPEQFGVVGMLAIFMVICQVLLDSGFGSALVQKKEVTDLDISSVFYFNVTMGIVLAGLLYLAAPWIAAYYEQPIVTPLTRVMSIMVVLNSVAAIQLILLTRKIDFKTHAKVGAIVGVASGAVGIFMAYRGFGVWSLVAQQVSGSAFRVVLLWFFCPWRPILRFSLRPLRQMFAFGSRVLASSVLARVFDYIYLPVIGKFYSLAIVGFYDRARRLEEMPSAVLTRLVTRVSFPVFSSIQDDNERLKRGMHKALGAVMFMNAPVMVGLAASAESLVGVLLTDKWLPCVPYLRLLCVLGLFRPLHALNLNTLNAKGRSDLFLRLELIKKALVILNITITWRWGVSAMILGQIALTIPIYYLNNYYVSKLIGYTVREQLQNVAKYLLSAGLMGAVVYSLAYVPFGNRLLLLVAQVVCGVAVYSLLSLLLRLPAFFEAWRVVGKRIPFHRPAPASGTG